MALTSEERQEIAELLYMLMPTKEARNIISVHYHTVGDPKEHDHKKFTELMARYTTCRDMTPAVEDAMRIAFAAGRHSVEDDLPRVLKFIHSIPPADQSRVAEAIISMLRRAE